MRNLQFVNENLKLYNAILLMYLYPPPPCLVPGVAPKKCGPPDPWGLDTPGDWTRGGGRVATSRVLVPRQTDVDDNEWMGIETDQDSRREALSDALLRLLTKEHNRALLARG